MKTHNKYDFISKKYISPPLLAIKIYTVKNSFCIQIFIQKLYIPNVPMINLTVYLDGLILDYIVIVRYFKHTY